MLGKRDILKRYPRLIRALLVVGGVFFITASVSYARALLAPNSPGWDLRSAEWVRDHHAGWALDLAEAVWFSVHRPSAEELRDSHLSAFPEPFARKREGLAPPVAEPPPVAPLFKDSLRAEGAWHAVGSTVNGAPALRCTSFRPDTTRPELSLAVARFTPELTRFVLVPGTRDPGGEWRWHGGIPKAERPNLLAAFNAGFRLNEARGGLYVEGEIARPLVGGAASLVISPSGNIDIVAWPAEHEPSAEQVAVRQNLRLLVDHGELLPGLEESADRSLRRANHDGRMWRSGLGIARDGAIFYVVGPDLTLRILATTLQHVGALRAMELDIHHQWTSFNVFQPATEGSAELVATKLVPGLRHPATRYLRPDDRDFVAVFVR